MKRKISAVLMLVVWAGSWSPAAEQAVHPIELCVRADDMGHALDINLAIIKTHTEGIVTSASLMPPTAYFDDAVARCRAHPKLAAGIHLTLMAVVPMRPVLPPEQVPSLVAPDGFLYRGGEDFVKARPKIDEVEKELRAQIRKCLATGLRFWYIDSHMSSGGGKDRPDIAALYPRLAEEFRLLFTQDPDGRYSGAKLVPAGLESWKTERLPDGTLVCWAVPGMPPEVRTRFLRSLENLQPGTWYTVCHPGLYSQRQAESVALVCSKEVQDIVRARGIRLISFADLWKRKYSK
jgi:predicted glycoside hydrolase/deacetylase ChbG (UPF0249 family)